MQLTIEIIIYVFYPLSVIIRLFPDNLIKFIFLTGFELSLVIIGMHFFILTNVYDPAAILIIAVTYIPFMIILTNPLSFSVNKIFNALRNWPVMIISDPVNYKNIFLKAIEEELIWRAAFINLAVSAGLPVSVIIPFGAVLFYAIHLRTKSKFYLLKEFEFLFFSTFIVTAYIISHSVLIVIIIHFIRNSFLLCYRGSNIKTELNYR